jgi:uncharacterized protein (TIGR03435 family)
VIAAKYVIGCAVILAAPAAGQTRPQLVVASVKPHPGTDLDTNIGPFPAGFKATGAPLQLLIQVAYRLKDYQIAAGPSWTREDRFDIEARAPEGMKFTPDQRNLMLQALLADRFALRVHLEKRELPALALTVTRNGAKMTPASGNHPDEPQLTLGRGFLKATGITAEGLADALSMNSDRQIVDKTGLSGKYDVTLKWSPDIRDPAGVPLVTALQEQLGLRLESMKAPVDVLVIDSAEKPSAN